MHNEIQVVERSERKMKVVNQKRRGSGERLSLTKVVRRAKPDAEGTKSHELTLVDLISI